MKNLIFGVCALALFTSACSPQSTSNKDASKFASEEDIASAVSKGEFEKLFKLLEPQLMTLPNAIDTNLDGELSSEEILNAPKQLKTLDKNKDGQLDYQEIGAYEADLPLVRMHTAVNVIDKDGDVIISADEIEDATNSLKYLDTNKDWFVDGSEIKMGRPASRPFYSTLPFGEDRWAEYRKYTTENAGPILPGEHPDVSDGYIFIHEAGDFNHIQSAEKAYLLNQKGERVHEWDHSGTSPEATVAYLLPNGNILRTFSDHHWSQDKFYPVGAHSSIELVDWDGNQLWEFAMSAPEKYSFHHDVEYMPNGNILAILYTGFTKEEAAAMGWDPKLSEGARLRKGKDGSELIWMDAILELKPNLKDGSTEIVWQWNSWDHLVQNKYPNKPNYGDITDPSKIDVNYLDLGQDIPFNNGQFFHINTVDYNPDLDMIMLSSPTYGELWVIDHSTNAEEVTSSKGGKHGKGGSLLFRWGNDEAFGADVRDNTYLYWQHDTQWIEKGLPGEGNILIYNNGTRRSLDDKYIPDPKVNIFKGSYTNLLEVKVPMTADGAFDKSKKPEIVWSWENPEREEFYSPFMSGATRMPNGNTIFNRAYDMYLVEVTPEGEKVLDFSLAGWGRLHRVYKYPPDYSGLRNLQLSNH